MIKQLKLGACALMLASCAGVSVNQLTVDGVRKPGTPNGAVYYLPKPYLLVTRLPAKSGAGGLPQEFHTAGAGGADKANGKDGGDKADDSGDSGGGDKPDTNPTPAGSGSASSFDARTDDYVVKLIYLPDRAHPMSITATTGAFGSAKLSPTFQDGWMLTGFTSEADSKVAEVLAQVASVISAVRAPKGSGAGGGEASKGAGGNEPSTDILKPGLYEFQYDASGTMIGLCAVNYFSSGGTKPADGRCIDIQ